MLIVFLKCFITFPFYSFKNIPLGSAIGFPSHSGADSLPPRADSRVLYVSLKSPFLPSFLSRIFLKLLILFTWFSTFLTFNSLSRGVSSCHVLADRKNKQKNSKSLFYIFYLLLIFKLKIFCII